MSKNSPWTAEEDFTATAEYLEREAAFRHCPVGILVVRENAICQVNPQLEELLGYSEKELLGKNPCLLHDRQDCPLSLLGNCDLQRDGGPAHTFEYPLKHRNGHVLWCKINGKHCNFPEGGGTVLSIVDVSKEYGYRQEVLRAKREWEATVNASPDMIALLDTEMRLQRANVSLCQAAGKSQQELIGCKCYDVFGNGEICAACPYDDTVRGKQSHRVRVTLKNPAGEFEVSCAPHLDENGQLLGTIHIVHDLRPLLREQHQSLSLQEKLLQNQKLESIAVLAAGVAHEFNNILQTISNRAEVVMLDHDAESHTASSLQAIIGSVSRASSICDQLLTFSGQRSGRKELVDPVPLVQQLAHWLSLSAPPTVKLKLDVGDTPGRLQIDVSQLKQLLTNLVTNAIEACDANGGDVTVCLSKREIAGTQAADWISEPPKPGQYVQLEVRDTGRGISVEHVARICDPFFTTKFQGRGLGLAAVLGIVRSNRGALQLENSVNQGCVFRALLPAVLHESTPERVTEEHKNTPSSGLVLLVDDEVDLSTTLRIGLQRKGYDVLIARDGQEAVRLLEEYSQRLSAVVLDLNMPGVSGLEVLHQLRELAPRLPVVLSSGYDEREVEAELRHDLTEFLHKPYLIKNLCLMLERMVNEPANGSN